MIEGLLLQRESRITQLMDGFKKKIKSNCISWNASFKIDTKPPV